jgi:hypothetical protein
MNIAEILKKYPKGTKLYSPLYGEIELVSVYDKKYPIVCSHKVNNVEYYRTFTEEGKCRDYNAELMLYPSRDQRDWNKFGVTEQETKHQFKPFDRVLVRDRNDREWGCDFFSHIAEDNRYICIYSWWKQCIPYEGNEHLLNTTNKPE